VEVRIYIIELIGEVVEEIGVLCSQMAFWWEL
jgi:hypothetical protein